MEDPGPVLGSQDGLEGQEDPAGHAPGVDHAEHLARPGQAVHQLGVGQLALVDRPHPAEGLGQGRRIGGQLPGGQGGPPEDLGVGQGGLGGGAQEHAGAVVDGQLAQGGQAGQQRLPGQHLGLVQDDHAPGQAVEFAAAGRTVGEERLEELHVGGHHQGRVPVLGRQLVAAPGRIVLALRPPGRGEVAVVLQHHPVAEFGLEYLAENPGVLLDDAGVGDDVDHPAKAMGQRVLEGEGQGGVGLAPAGGHGERKEPGRLGGPGQAGRQDGVALPVERRLPGPGAQAGQEAFHHRPELGHPRAAAPPGAPRRVQEGFGIQEVGVRQAGEDHAGEEGQGEARRLRHGRQGRRRQGQARQEFPRRQAGGFHPFPEPVLEAGLRGSRAVGQAGVVAGQGIGQEAAGLVPESSHRSLGPGGGVVHRRPARQPSLEPGGGLAQVVEQPGRPSPGAGPEGRRELPGSAGHQAEVVAQLLPAAGRHTFPHVGQILGHGFTSNWVEQKAGQAGSSYSRGCPARQAAPRLAVLIC